MKLKSCYKTTLTEAKKHGISTIALCGVSTGIYGFPPKEAAKIALEMVRWFLEDNAPSVERIIFCTFSDRDEEIYKSLIPLYFPPPSVRH